LPSGSVIFAGLLGAEMQVAEVVGDRLVHRQQLRVSGAVFYGDNAIARALRVPF
jgi:hypothetical protein